MGVTYKLKEDVVQFIISQRQSHPLASCRQLAEDTSQKFGLHLSKSSVHDVLKESGVITPRGRKPKTAFKIPQEKRKQIQANLSQVKLLSPPVPEEQNKEILQAEPPVEPKINLIPDIVESSIPFPDPPPEVIALPQKNDFEVSAEYEGAGKIFVKAALWDLGIFSEENIREMDWKYYLTYSKGVKVNLENNKSFFMDLPLPLERCIKEVADGLINNIRPFLIQQIADENLLKASMEGQVGFKIESISIVDRKDHILLEFDSIMESNRSFMIVNRVFVESNEYDVMTRSKMLFFPQLIDNNDLIDNILGLKGWDTTNNDEKVVTIIIDDTYENKAILQGAVERLNEMYLRDERDRLVKVKIQEG